VNSVFSVVNPSFVFIRAHSRFFPSFVAGVYPEPVEGW